MGQIYRIFWFSDSGDDDLLEERETPVAPFVVILCLTKTGPWAPWDDVAPFGVFNLFFGIKNFLILKNDKNFFFDFFDLTSISLKSEMKMGYGMWWMIYVDERKIERDLSCEGIILPFLHFINQLFVSHFKKLQFWQNVIFFGDKFFSCFTFHMEVLLINFDLKVDFLLNCSLLSFSHSLNFALSFSLSL